MGLYFVYTGDGIEYHDTEAAARKSAEDWIDEYRTLPEWDEAVDRVCWGDVRQQTKEITVGPEDEYVDYILEDVAKRNDCANSNR